MMSVPLGDGCAWCGLLSAGAPAPVWSARVWESLWNPWFLFGMAAQAVFFLRFVVQWIVSERRGRSTIPIAFWYLSLVGSALIFVYAIHRADAVFMLAQLLACFIYVRNLMLIYRQRGRLQRRASQNAATAKPAAGRSGEDP